MFTYTFFTSRIELRSFLNSITSRYKVFFINTGSNIQSNKIIASSRRKLPVEVQFYILSFIYGSKSNLLQGYIFRPFPPRGGGIFVPIEKQGRIWRRTWKKEGKRGKRKREEKKVKSDKTHVKIPLWSLNDRKKSTKTGKNFRGGGKNFIPFSAKLITL